MSKFSNVVKEKKLLLEDFFLSHGYTKNRWGHWSKTNSKGNKIRFRFMGRVIRREIYGEENKTWFHSHSASYKDVGVNDDNKLVGFVRSFW